MANRASPRSILDHLIDLKDDGSFRLNQEYFDYCTGLKMTNDRFAQLFGVPARKPEELLDQVHMDLAASIQSVTEEAILRLSRSLAAETGARNLCLAGGVALNCVANGKVLRDLRFDKVWVQPAAGDAGGSLGAALAAYHLELDRPRHLSNEMDGMSGSYLGPSFDEDEIRERLTAAGALFEELGDDEVIDRTASAPLPTKRRWAGSKAEWNSAPGRSARARSWPMPAVRQCSAPLTSRSNTGRASGHLPRRCCAKMSPTGSSSTSTVRIC